MAIPGVIRTQQRSIILYDMERGDWEWYSNTVLLQKNTFVRVVQKNKDFDPDDVALIVDIPEPYHTARILLIPHTPHQIGGRSLFHPITFPYLAGKGDPHTVPSPAPINRDDFVDTGASFAGREYECGLLTMTVSLWDLAPFSTAMTSEVAELFLESGHPAISDSYFLCPRGWVFDRDDWVAVRGSEDEGRVIQSKANYALVNMGVLGIIRIGWQMIQKRFKSHEYVVEVRTGRRGVIMSTYREVSSDYAAVVEEGAPGDLPEVS